MKAAGVQSKDPSFINQILVHLRLASVFLPDYSEERIESLRGLMLIGRRYFDLTGDIDVLKECIQASETEIKLMEIAGPEEGGPGSKEYATSLAVLAFHVMALYDRFGRMEDLSRCIDTYRKAIELFEDIGDPAKNVRPNLAAALYRRFERFSTTEDIDEAIDNHEIALALIDEEDLYGSIHTWLLSNLGSTYYTRFKHNGKLEDLETGLGHLNEALKYSSPNDESYTIILTGIGGAMMRRFEALGQLTDIHEAISAYRKALHHTPFITQGLFSFYNNLSLSLVLLYQRTGTLSVLEEAVEMARSALKCTPPGHPTTASTLNTLATHLVTLSGHEDDTTHVNEAIELYKRSLTLLPSSHPLTPVVLDNLGSCYNALFKRTHKVEHINKAVEAHQSALQKIAPEGIDYTIILAQIGRALRMRYRFTKQGKDIDESIHFMQQAIDSLPQGHATRPGCIKSLADCYEDRLAVRRDVEGVEDQQDRQRAIDLYAEVARNEVADPQSRLSAARSWAAHALFSRDPVQSMDALNTGVELISLVGGMEQTVEQRYHAVSEHSLFVLNAVAFAIMQVGKLDKAIEWLEQGRGLVWSQITSLRTSLDDLQAVDPALAEEFRDVSKRLDAAGARDLSKLDVQASQAGTNASKIAVQDEATAHVQLAHKHSTLLARIRTVPSFEHFLRPLPASAILEGLPKEGVVVALSVHPVQCDAIALRHGKEPLHIRLPDLTNDDASRLANRLKEDLISSGLCSDLNASRWRGETDGVSRGFKRAQRKVEAISGIEAVLSELWVKLAQPVVEALELSVSPIMQRIPGGRLNKLNHCSRRKTRAPEYGGVPQARHPSCRFTPLGYTEGQAKFVWMTLRYRPTSPPSPPSLQSCNHPSPNSHNEPPLTTLKYPARIAATRAWS